MKSSITLGVAALVSLGLASQAVSAVTYSLSPKNKPFVGTGKTTLVKGSLTIACTAKFTGKTTAAGVGEVTAATFTGDAGICNAVKTVGTPWLSTETSLTKGTINKVTVNASIAGKCGPTNVPVTISKTGVIAFTNVVLAGGCKVNGSIATKPAITIVKN